MMSVIAFAAPACHTAYTAVYLSIRLCIRGWAGRCDPKISSRVRVIVVYGPHKSTVQWVPLRYMGRIDTQTVERVPLWYTGMNRTQSYLHVVDNQIYGGSSFKMVGYDNSLV